MDLETEQIYNSMSTKPNTVQQDILIILIEKSQLQNSNFQLVSAQGEQNLAKQVIISLHEQVSKNQVTSCDYP